MSEAIVCCELLECLAAELWTIVRSNNLRDSLLTEDLFHHLDYGYALCILPKLAEK